MNTIEIPREHWANRLAEFTLTHDGWLASVDVFGPDIGAQPEFESLPLIGIAVDRAGAQGTLTISVARTSGEHFTHVVDGVTRIWSQEENAADAALEFESGGGVRTVLRLHGPARPSVSEPARPR